MSHKFTALRIRLVREEVDSIRLVYLAYGSIASMVAVHK